MKQTSLQSFIENVSASWGPLTSELVDGLRVRMERLLETPVTEDWVSALYEEAPESRELFRHPTHGFVLLAHTEPAGLYRPPHDHGTGWVVYGVQRGETEMTTYARVADPSGATRIVKRGTTILRPGQVEAYLPGDIHDTRCIAGPLLLFRFTSCDLKTANVTRYAQRNGVWSEGAACLP